MKKITLLTISIAALFFLSDCSKNDARIPVPPYPHTIVGLWVGTSQADSTPSIQPRYFSFEVKSDSSITVQGQVGFNGDNYYGSGAWHLSGSVFTAKVMILNLGLAGTSQIMSATYDKTEGSLKDGIWQIVSSGSGTFSVLRIH